jgi:hypothetical protein
MPVDKPKAGETRDEYLQYCIPLEINAGYEVEQATAICISYYDKDKMSKITDTTSKVMARVAYDTKYRGINLLAEAGDDPCQSGYEQYGMKEGDAGRLVPNCIPIQEPK